VVFIIGGVRIIGGLHSKSVGGRLKFINHGKVGVFVEERRVVVWRKDVEADAVEGACDATTGRHRRFLEAHDDALVF